MKNGHPYSELEKLPVWKVLNRGIKDLQSNGDIEEKTAREYIVGYLAKILVEAELITEVSSASASRPLKPLNRS